jgi:thiamine-phosphate diphosphorylase
MVTLPRLLLLTDRSQVLPGRRLVDVIAAAVHGGVRGVVLRERDLPPAERKQLAEELRKQLDQIGGVLLAAWPMLTGADGVHLPVGAPMPDAGDRPDLVGRSCHNADELAAAAADSTDYVTLSPVAETASKPGYGPALGAERFGALAARTPIPVFALGGVTAFNAATWLRAGAHGIAVMGPLMRADDPAGLATAYLNAMGALT